MYYVFLCIVILILCGVVGYFKNLSEKDIFTGCYNKTWFMGKKNSKLLRMMKGTHKYKGRFGILFVDMDNFKEVNTKFGHVYGDKVILRTVKALKNKIRTQRYRSLRGKDFIVKFGGDEYIIVFTSIVDHEDLENKAEALRLNVKIETGRTISIGGMVYTLHQDISVSHIVEKINKKLYFAKEKGKDKICLCEESN